MYVCMYVCLDVCVYMSGSQFHKVFRYFGHTLEHSTSNWG